MRQLSFHQSAIKSMKSPMFLGSIGVFPWFSHAFPVENHANDEAPARNRGARCPQGGAVVVQVFQGKHLMYITVIYCRNTYYWYMVYMYMHIMCMYIYIPHRFLREILGQPHPNHQPFLGCRRQTLLVVSYHESFHTSETGCPPEGVFLQLQATGCSFSGFCS